STDRLCETLVSWRLSFCDALASGLVTSRITRPVRSRRFSHFNSYRDISRHFRLEVCTWAPGESQRKNGNCPPTLLAGARGSPESPATTSMSPTILCRHELL